MDRRILVKRGAMGLLYLMTARQARGQDGPSSDNDVKLQQCADLPLTRFAFGSCNKSEKSQAHWQTIGADQPELWIWLGDIIYGDHAKLEERRHLYQNLKDSPYYRDFRAQVPIIGTYDDHDYGTNNADGSFKDKENTKRALLEFLDVPPDAPAWQQQGVYQKYEFGPAGARTLVVLLDLRFNQVKSGDGATLLGEEQWNWFEETLASSTANFLLIGSSLNVLSTNGSWGLEGWNKFPYEQSRLFDLLAAFNRPVLIISGDRHFAEVNSLDVGYGVPIFECMSSGMTHSTPFVFGNDNRVGQPVKDRNYALVHMLWENSVPSLKVEIKAPSNGNILATFDLAYS